VAAGLANVKRLIEVATTTVTAPSQAARSSLRGKDFMLDDLTSGADRDGR